MQLELHDYRRCPFCIRTRIVLHLKNIPYTRVHEPLREWTDWMRANVQHPRVPILRVTRTDGSQEIMGESNDINLWLDKNFDGPKLTPENDEEVLQMRVWWDWCADKFKPMIDLYKYGEGRVFNEKKHIQHTKDLRMLVGVINSALQTRSHLVGSSMTLADIAVIPFVRQIMRTRNGEFDFSDYPHVTRWAAGVLDTEWFEDIVMSKE